MDRWTRRCSPPDNEVPHGVPASVLLIRTDTLAVAVTGMSVYTTGVSIEVAIRLRVTPPGVNSRDLHQMIGGHRFPDDSGPDRRLLLGVEYSDGRTADNIDGRPLPATIDNNDETPLLSLNRGSGGEGTHDQSYWLSPVSPDGGRPMCQSAIGTFRAVLYQQLTRPGFTLSTGPVVDAWRGSDVDAVTGGPAPGGVEVVGGSVS